VGGECVGGKYNVLAGWRRIEGRGKDREREWMRRGRKTSLWDE
jgi:hypothetical protein